MGQADWQAMGIPPDISRNGYLVGTAGFDLPDWVGRFYPPDSTVRKRLDIYQAYFSFLEISNYFSDPQRETYVQLAKNLRDSTECSVRVPKRIACPKVWNEDIGKSMLLEVIQAVGPLVECGRLYSLVFSLDEKTVRSQSRLDYVLATTSLAQKNRIDAHVEFWHKSWHTYGVLDVLKGNGIGIANIEIPVSHAFPLKGYATSHKGYIRYCGRNRRGGVGSREGFDYRYTTSDIEEMVEAQQALNKKVGTAAVVYGNVVGAQAIANGVQNILLLNHAVEVDKMMKNPTRSGSRNKDYRAKGIRIN